MTPGTHLALFCARQRDRLASACLRLQEPPEWPVHQERKVPLVDVEDGILLEGRQFARSVPKTPPVQ